VRGKTTVLSSAKIGRTSWRYYQAGVAVGACEYYLGAGEQPGVWVGRGLPELGLEPGSALEAGVHPKVVQERLGHSNVSITLDLYSHVSPAMQTDAADRVAALILG
jgi:integrase